MVFSENSRGKILCILHLVRLGNRYLSLKNAVWDEETNISPALFRTSMARINPAFNLCGSNFGTKAGCRPASRDA